VGAPGDEMTTAANARAGIVAERMVRGLGWCSLVALVAVWFSISVLGDRLWWTVMLLFGPRWLMVAPWLGMIPWLLADARRAILPTLAGLAIAVFGIMGFHLGLHRASESSGIPLRVLELNADGAHGVEHASDIIAEIRRNDPAIVVIVECEPNLASALHAMAGYTSRTSEYRGVCLFSHDSILEWNQRDQQDLWRQSGAGYIVRAIVRTAAGPVRVGLVHLATPRQALDAYFDLSELPRQGPNTRANMHLRDEESALARQWILAGPDYPTIVAGDFNLTPESAIYKRYWGDLRNAFGRAGFGTGYTKHTRHWGARIDQILTSDDIGAHASFTGKDVGSDHLPLIADLVLPALPRSQRTSAAP
jgi:endonuclease/exonuclease/phosphatase (EEP) superfamily protein YafD